MIGPVTREETATGNELAEDLPKWVTVAPVGQGVL